VHIPGPTALRAIAASAVILLGSFSTPASAAAATASYELSDQSVLAVAVAEGDVEIKTWDRTTVRADWTDGEPVTAARDQQNVPAVLRIQAQTVMEGTSRADVVAASLPLEDFPLTGVDPGRHDLVQIGSTSATPVHLSITIPATTRLLYLRVMHGDLNLSDYRGTSVVYAGNATVSFDRVGGDAFVQALNGHFYATDSNFNRLRARTNRGELVFERCHIKQIEASTLTGAIVYDNGTFEPGLAHFESDRGNIALGVNGNAQLIAHSEGGRVFSMLGARTDGATSDARDARAQLGTGGLVVSASTSRGNVYLYDGSLADRRTIQAAWRPVHQALVAKRRAPLGRR
jgi:hypothetical protein